MREKDPNPGAVSFDAAAVKRVTPQDIQQREFAVSRLGGYRMRDVDEFLDELTDAFTALSAENERLRAQGGGAPVVGTPDLDDVARQADEIIGRARQEADRIVSEARRSNAGTSGTPDRQSVAPFLEQERAFLNSLAALVQGHTEAVRGMVRETRAPSQSREAGPPAPKPQAASSSGAVPAEAPPEPRAAPEPKREAPAKHETQARPEKPKPKVAPNEDPAKTQALPEASSPVRVEQPEPAAVARSEDRSPDEGDDSLRELFWGEEG